MNPLEVKIPVELPTELHEAVKMVGGPDKLMDILAMHLITVARTRKRREMLAQAEKWQREKDGVSKRGSTQGGHGI